MADETLVETNTEKNNLELSIPELTNMSAKLLHQLFVSAPKDKAKSLFKDIKQGNTYPLGTITLQDQLELSMSLVLSYSDFVGPGFNFDAFSVALQGVLKRLSGVLNAQQSLNILTSEDKRHLLIHQLGSVQVGSNPINIMALGFEFGEDKNILLKLMFLEPTQYQPEAE